MTDQSECQICSSGHFCDGSGLPEEVCTSDCDCENNQGSDCTDCKTGSECTNGYAVSCAIGFFNNDQTTGNCEPCISGTYTDVSNSLSCDNECAAGYFCDSEASREYPSRDDQTNFGPCPAGNSCNNGIATPCQIGFYQDRTGQSECKECPAGFFCDETELDDFSLKNCPFGFYCPQNTISIADKECPAGTYRSVTG